MKVLRTHNQSINLTHSENSLTIPANGTMLYAPTVEASCFKILLSTSRILRWNRARCCEVTDAATARQTVEGWDVATLATWSRVFRCRRDRCPIDDSNSASGGERRCLEVEVTWCDVELASKSAEGWPDKERSISWSIAAAAIWAECCYYETTCCGARVAAQMQLAGLAAQIDSTSNVATRCA